MVLQNIQENTNLGVIQLPHIQSPLSVGEMFQDPQWVPETMGSTEPYNVWFVIFIYSWVGSVFSVDMLDKRMIHILVGWTRRAVRFLHATQNGHSLTYELFIPGISHLIFLDCWLGVTETVESDIVAGGGGAIVIPVIEFLWFAKECILTTTK